MPRNVLLDRMNRAKVAHKVTAPIAADKGNIYIQDTSLGPKLWIRKDGDSVWSNAGGAGERKKKVIDLVDQ